ncbi:MAG: transposase [Myxococcota bacterium]
MGYPIRWASHELVFVTVRCHQERFFLTPYSTRNAVWKPKNRRTDDRKGKPRHHGKAPQRCAQPRKMVDKVLGKLKRRTAIVAADYTENAYNVVGVWIAKALAWHKGVRLHAVKAMDNHLHYLLSVPKGLLSRFMRYLNGQMARALNRLLGRNHQLWARRYSAEPVLDHGAAVDRLGYTETNACAANLIDRASDWPGVSSHHNLEGTRVQKFVFFNRTRWHRNHKPKVLNKYLEVVELRVDRLPGCEQLTETEYADFVRRLIAEREQGHARARKDAGKSVLPLDKLKATDPFARPNNPKRSPRPPCHSSCRKLRAKYIQDYRNVRCGHMRSSARCRDGDRTVKFPEGTHPPPILDARAA